MEKVRLFIHSSPCLEWCVMYRLVRIVMDQVRSSRINVLPAAEPDIHLQERRFRYLYLQVLIMVRASASVRRVNRVQTEVREVIFQRQDMNIFSTAPLTYAQAALGGTVRINTVDGEVEYEVKPGTQTDTRIRLKGKGVPSLRNKNVRGDHYVTFVVQVPTNLNEEAKEALRKFDEACGNRPKSKDSDDFEKPEKKKKSFMDKLKETFED